MTSTTTATVTTTTTTSSTRKPRARSWRITNRAAGTVLVALGLVGLSACAGDTTPGSRLATTRVLGARITAGDDPARTWPRPGETALVDWVVAGPRPRALAWSFRTTACAAAMDDDDCVAGGAGVPPAAPSASDGHSDGSTPPTLSVTAPGADAGEVDRLIVSGVICAGGAVADAAAAPWSRCASVPEDGQPTVDETDVRLTIRLQRGASGNAPPSLADDVLTWDGQPWQGGAGDPSLSSADGACAADAATPAVVRSDDEHEVIVTVDAADREPIPVEAGGAPGAPARESAQVSAFATLGSFATQFGTVLSADTRATSPLRFKWTPPSVSEAGLDASGRLVRFVFVLRDGRGGLDVGTRAVCLVPPPSKS